MYERLYDKNLNPTFEELIQYCGESGPLWMEFEEFLRENYDLKNIVHSSNKEGWGVNYKHNKAYLCDIHAEQQAFVVFTHLRTEQVEKIKEQLSEKALLVWDHKYPCGEGGWIRYRVTKQEHLLDIKLFISAKLKRKTK